LGGSFAALSGGLLISAEVVFGGAVPDSTVLVGVVFRGAGTFGISTVELFDESNSKAVVD